MSSSTRIYVIYKLIHLIANDCIPSYLMSLRVDNSMLNWVTNLFACFLIFVVEFLDVTSLVAFFITKYCACVLANVYSILDIYFKISHFHWNYSWQWDDRSLKLIRIEGRSLVYISEEVQIYIFNTMNLFSTQKQSLWDL